MQRWFFPLHPYQKCERYVVKFWKISHRVRDLRKNKNKINTKINKVEIYRHVHAINKEKPARGAIFRQDLEVCDVFRRDVSLSDSWIKAVKVTKAVSKTLKLSFRVKLYLQDVSRMRCNVVRHVGRAKIFKDGKSGMCKSLESEAKVGGVPLTNSSK